MIPAPANDLTPWEGLIGIPSRFGPKETMDRLQREVRVLGMTVFVRIDHAAEAAAVGLTLAPTELIVFGNARAGSLLMQAAQTVGIDLPLKALVWEDTLGKTWISYSDPRWIAQRHRIADADPVVSKIAAALSAISRVAAGIQRVLDKDS